MRRSKSPYGAPLSFVKENDEFRGVGNYRALKILQSGTIFQFQGLRICFDRIKYAEVFSKLDLKTVFHQTKMKPQDDERNAFFTE